MEKSWGRVLFFGSKRIFRVYDHYRHHYIQRRIQTVAIDAQATVRFSKQCSNNFFMKIVVTLEIFLSLNLSNR